MQLLRIGETLSAGACG